MPAGHLAPFICCSLGLMRAHYRRNGLCATPACYHQASGRVKRAWPAPQAPEHTSQCGDFPARTPYRAKRGFVTSALFQMKLFREDLFLKVDLLELEFQLHRPTFLKKSFSQGHLSFQGITPLSPMLNSFVFLVSKRNKEPQPVWLSG